MTNVGTSRGQETRIIDNSGNLVSVTDNKLNVNAAISIVPLPTGAATSAKQLADNHNVTVTTLPATPSGTNLIGKVGIDQTTPGTTNKVSIGSDVVHTIIDSGAIASLTDGTQKTRLTDGYGFSVENTPTDEIRVAESTRLVGTTFNGTTIDSSFWVSTLANNGTATQGNGQISLGSSTTNNGSSIMQSQRRGRYVSGVSNKFRSVLQLGDIGVASNTRRWGMFDGTDGAYFELAGTTLSACVMTVHNELKGILCYRWSFGGYA